MSDGDPFDVDAYLRQPLVARVATAGPTVRPVWYLWEEGAFWWLTGPWSRLRELLALDPAVALVIDTCDLGTGETRQVIASGRAEVVPSDVERTRRKLQRYLGADEGAWDPRFGDYLTRTDADFVRLAPDRLVALDLSFEPSP